MQDTLKVKRAVRGDKNAFSELIHENKEYLYKVSFLYLKNEDDALEVLDETVYKAYSAITRLKKPENFKTWITQILINTAINFIRLRNKTLFIEDVNLCEEYILENNKENKLDLSNALKQLKDKNSEILKLRYVEDMKISDIAEKVNLPQSTVKTNIRRSLKILKDKLGDDYYG